MGRSMSKIISYLLTMVVTLICGMFGCDPVSQTETSSREKIVHTVDRNGLSYIEPDIIDKGKLLNDLMLSPYWKVEKKSNGNYIAKVRYVSDDFGMSFEKRAPMFLFSFINKGKTKIPEGQVITSEYMSYESIYSSFHASIIFEKPDKQFPFSLYKKGEKIQLGICESYSDKVGPNSWSELVFKLSRTKEIYLILHEQGEDKSRQKTFQYAYQLLKEISKIAKLPNKYHTRDIYSKFYNFRFAVLQEKFQIKRVPASQDRDTFYGYFKTNKNIDYNGINIKVSHPKYCGTDGECTRDYSRLQKAEYLGKPYFDNDLLYFQIEDNAIYLSSRKYDKMFGTFSGKKSFKAKLEVLNGKGKVLYEKYDKFKGWER